MKFLILGNSITYNLHVQGATTVSIPGLDWKGARKYILENQDSMKNTIVFIIVGPVRFTSLHKNRKEVAFVEPKYSVHRLFSTFYTNRKDLNIKPIISTFPYFHLLLHYRLVQFSIEHLY